MQDDSIEMHEIPDDAQPYRHRTVSMHRDRRLSRAENWYHAASGQQAPIGAHVERIVEKIAEEEEERTLATDGGGGAAFRAAALRSMPQSLTLKKLVKRQLESREARAARRISAWRQLRAGVAMSSKKARRTAHDALYTCELWYATLKRIEGEFGSATALYFRFFRLMFLLNCLTCALVAGFIVLPQCLLSGFAVAAPLGPEDFLTGEGYFTQSVLYYGAYSARTITVIHDVAYSMPRGYFYTMIVAYVMLLGVLAYSMARSYRINFIETKGGLKNAFAHKVFCNWDFGIATENAARLKSSAIFHEFKEMLEEELNPPRKTSLREAFVLFMLRLAAHLLVLAIVAAIGYGTWRLLGYAHGVVTAAAINGVIHVVPALFPLIARYEDYRNPRHAFNVLLLRTFALQLAVLGALAAFWLTQASRSGDCWETELGQEVYRLMLFDCFFAIGFYALEKFVLWMYAGLRQRPQERTEFEVVHHALQLVYNQTLFWMGLFFAPLLSAIVVVKYFVMWYLTTYVALRFSKPSQRFWRATNTQTWLLVLAFVTLLLALGLLGSIVATVPASDCGPFVRSNDTEYIYDFLRAEILRMENGALIWQVLAYLLKPGVVAMIIVSMLGFIYYLRAKALAQENVVRTLGDMIVVERRDKEYLLRRIRDLAKEWQFTSCATADPMQTPPDRYKQVANQTEFQRHEGTATPLRADESTSPLTSTSTSPSSRHWRKFKHQ